MRPLPYGSGKKEIVHDHRPDRPGFNEAAPLRKRKAYRITQQPPLEVGFNEAAPLRKRKDPNRPQRKRCAHGFNEAAPLRKRKAR